MNRDAFVMYESFYEAIKELDADTFKQCMIVLCEYAYRGIDASDSPSTKMFLSMAKPQVDANNRRYENGRKGGRPKNKNETKSKPSDNQTITKTKPNDNQTITESKPKDKEKVKDKENVKDKRTFTKPSLEDVQTYIVDMNMRVDAQSFIDYYESNGWRVGRNPMKDWKATLRRWNKNPIHKGKEIPSYMTSSSESEIADASDVADVKSMIENLKA